MTTSVAPATAPSDDTDPSSSSSSSSQSPASASSEALHPATRGLLLALGPAAFTWSTLELPADRTAAVTLAAQLAGALIASLAGRQVATAQASLVARIAGTIGVVLWGGGFVVDHLTRPSRSFIALLGVVAVLLVLWPATDLRDGDLRRRRFDDILAAAGVATIVTMGTWLTAHPSAPSLIGLGLTMTVVTVMFARRSFWRRLPRWPRLAVLAGLAVGVSVPFVAATAVAVAAPTLLDIFSHHDAGPQAPVSAVVVAIVGLVPLCVPTLLAIVGLTLRARRRAAMAVEPSTEPGLLDIVLLHPPRILVTSFSVLCALGTILLALPSSSADGAGVALIDAAFTAVSATCVTGLAVLDTAVDFSFSGQLVILLFIQVGGLGIMVFSAAAVVVLGRRLSVTHEAAAVDLVGATGRAGLGQAVRAILLVSLATEAIAALLLWPAFVVAGDDIFTGLWRAVFHSISAFCNAGFALQSTSLMPYAHHPFILAVVGLTFVVGGLGPAVMLALLQQRPTLRILRGGRRTPHRRLPLQTRLVLWTSAVLLLGPAVLIAVLEWNHSLDDLPTVHKLTNALFQSATLRTAGFNSVDFAAIGPATWTIMVVVMFIGGSPGSTAGGVKTTTIAVIALAVMAIVRGQERVDVGGRTISWGTILRAAASMTVGVLSCLGAIIALQLTQQMPLDVLIFEVVSALGTVGISMGGTGLLDEVGKVVIILCMFAGRIGPLTFFVFLASRTPWRSQVKWPEEQIAVG